MIFHQHLSRGLRVIFAAAVLSFAALAQALPEFSRPRTYDVQHYVIRVSFDHEKRQVFGDTTVSLRPLAAGFREAVLDAAALRFSSVTLEPQGKALKYRTVGARVHVTLDRAFSPEETVELRFRYTAVPRKGVYFVPQEWEGDKQVHSAQIWTQGEPDEAHHWFPSFDFPNDKATTEQLITVAEDETVVGNGELVGRTMNADGTATHHFRMSSPIPTYLVSFVVGKYAKVEERYGEVPLGYYVYPGLEPIVPRAFGKTREMMRVFEELTGVKYPFNKYDQTIVSNFPLGGMENVTATTLADTEVLLYANPLFAAGVEDLISHEIAHSWFGNLVTCENWAELWLNEGFATFMEAAFRERRYGRDSYDRKLAVDAQTFIADDAVNIKRNGLFNRNAGNVAALFERPATTYNKGGVVVHMLRETVGDEAFWKGVRAYLEKNRFGSVRTPDLRAAMEEASGRDLKWFFDQWVYGLGYPKLSVTQAYRDGTLSLTVRQTQRIEKFGPPAFRLPLEIDITSDAGTRTETLDVTRRLQTFTFKLDAPPREIVVDKRRRLPLKTVRIAGTL